MVKVVIHHEDKWGEAFFRILVQRMKNENIITKRKGKWVGLKTIHQVADCNPRTSKLLINHLLDKEIKAVLITRDADGDIAHAQSVINTHIPDNYPISISIGIFNYEIEDLIILDKGMTLIPHPSEYLEQHINYQKSDLPNFAQSLNLKTSPTMNHPIIQTIIKLFS